MIRFSRPDPAACGTCSAGFVAGRPARHRAHRLARHVIETSGGASGHCGSWHRLCFLSVCSAWGIWCWHGPELWRLGRRLKKMRAGAVIDVTKALIAVAGGNSAEAGGWRSAQENVRRDARDPAVAGASGAAGGRSKHGAGNFPRTGRRSGQRRARLSRPDHGSAARGRLAGVERLAVVLHSRSRIRRGLT